MSRATKRKHVISELTSQEFRKPQEDQKIVRVIQSRGNNLHEVESNGENFLVSMPMKFRRNVWVKRGDFLLVESIKEGDKVKAEIVAPLTRDYIRFLKEENAWPAEFDESTEISDVNDELVENTNRPPVQRRESSSDSELSDS